MKRKINLRMVAIAVLAVTATMLCITFVYYGLFKEQVRKDLAVSAKLLKDTHYFESVNTDTDEIDLSTDIDELRVSWIDADGTVIYDNDTDAADLQNHADRPEVRAAFDEGEGESVRRSDTLNKNTFYYAVLLDNGTVLRVATKAESIWSVFGKALPVIALIILAIIALCIALSRMLTRQLISPIERMGERLDDPSVETPYSELQPFLLTIRKQHADILSAAKARQDFTANVSHELKTPLTAISGYAELLENGMVAEEQKSHFYREIRRNAARLLTLINDTIRLSELDRSERNPAFEELDLNEVVLECIEGLKISAAQRDIEVSYEGESCRIRGSRDMLRELAENLIQNAVRYNNPGGHVNVRVGRSEGGSACLVVKDDGIGIPASEQERIFERFYRVDKSRSKDTGGTGLGLAIVKHIVELHDARISLDSTPAVGTTIEVDFR